MKEKIFKLLKLAVLILSSGADQSTAQVSCRRQWTASNNIKSFSSMYKTDQTKPQRRNYQSVSSKRIKRSIHKNRFVPEIHCLCTELRRHRDNLTSFSFVYNHCGGPCFVFGLLLDRNSLQRSKRYTSCSYEFPSHPIHLGGCSEMNVWKRVQDKVKGKKRKKIKYEIKTEVFT